MHLHECQHEFKAALLAQSVRAFAPPPFIASVDALERLAVYRDTITSTLVKALGLTFPTVRRLVGADFFDTAAAQFAKDHLPACADLNQYGQAFPGFIGARPGCAPYPYLADSARLDWAVSQALHADGTPALAPQVLHTLLDHAHAARFVAHPAVSLLASHFPIDEIRQAVLGEDEEALAAIDLTGGACRLLVERVDLQAVVHRLAPVEWKFARDFLGGNTLAQALERAGPDAPVAHWIAQHVAQGRVVGVRSHDQQEHP